MKKHSSLLHTKSLSLDEQISLYENNIHFKRKQVDILIFKNQALQILYKFMYIKLHKLQWIETYENLIPTKLNSYTIQGYCYDRIINTNIPYNWQAGS